MTTRSVPAGSEESACHTMADSAPDTRLSVRAMSRSRLIPGKTTTADFIISALRALPLPQHLDAVVLDHRVGQQFLGGVFQRRLGACPVGAIDLDIEHLALADAGHPADTKRLQSTLDRLALRIENTGFQGDGDAGLHLKAEIERIPPPRNLSRPGSHRKSTPAQLRMAQACGRTGESARCRQQAAAPSRTPIV